MKKLLLGLGFFFFAFGGYAAEINVAIANFAFQPSEIVAQVGDVLVFTNHDSAPHNVVPDQNSPLQFVGSRVLRQGEVFVLEVTQPLSIVAKCGLHPRMPGVSVFLQ